MNCRELLSVVILFFCTNIRAAPPSKSKSLPQGDDEYHRSTSLSTIKLPLAICSVSDSDACQLYSDTFPKFTKALYGGNLTKDVVFETPTITPDLLCSDLVSRLGPEFKLLNASDQGNSALTVLECTLICFKITSGAIPHPACAAAWWMLNGIVNKVATPDHVINANISSSVPQQQQQARKPELSPIVQSPHTEEIHVKPSAPAEVPPSASAEVPPSAPAGVSAKPFVAADAVVHPKEPSPSRSSVKVQSTPAAPVVVTPPLGQVDDLSPKVPQSDANSEQTNENLPSDHESQIGVDADGTDYDGDNEKSLNDKSVISDSDLMNVQKPPQDYEKQESIVPVSDPFFTETGSNFFSYFLFGMFACIILYVVYNNKSKILALVLEGRRSQGGRNGRKKHTAAYRKLDTNLEEAITSSTTSGRASQIIY